MRIALVTGAGGAIGAAIAARLVADGFSVVCNDVDPATAAETAARVGGVAAPFDVSDQEAVVAAVEEFRPVDVLVANHAMMTMAPFLEESPADWRRTLEVNLLGTALLIGAVVAGMRERGWGRIVAIASEWGVVGWPRAASYAASKGGIVSLVRSAAVALAADGIAVNAVAPGVTDTPQLDVDARDAGLSHEAMVGRYAEGIPLGRVGSVEDVAACVSLLCSEEAAAFVGQVIHPNGGTTRAR